MTASALASKGSHGLPLALVGGLLGQGLKIVCTEWVLYDYLYREDHVGRVGLSKMQIL